METSNRAPATGTRRSRLLAAVAATALAVPLALPSAAQAQEDTIVIARDMDLNSLDPSRAWCDTCQIYLTAAYDQLVRVGPDNKSLVPRLAASWEVSEDGLSYTFRLDPAATFSDGSPVEAKDVKFSLERLKNLKAGASFMVEGISSIETPDAKTVVVKLSAPDPEFLGKVSSPYGAIMNADVVSEHGGSAAADADSADQAEGWLLENSAGSGAFVLESYRPDDELRLAANPNYWREAPDAATIVMRESQDAVAQMQMLQSGGADIAMQVDPDTAEIAAAQGVTTELVPSYNFLYVALSPGAAGLEVPLSPKVREAIGLAIDYEGVLEFTTGGAADLIAAPVPNGFPGTDGLPMPEQDIEKAKALLEEEGVGDGFSMVAAYPEMNIYGVDLTTMMQKIQQDLSKVNIELELQPVTFAVWRDRVGGEHIPMTAVFFAPDYYGSGQYANYFSMVPGSPWYARAGGEEAEGLLNTRSQELMEQVRTAAPEEAPALYREMALEMIRDRVIIPLVNPKLVLAYRDNVEGVRYAVCCNLPLEELSKN
ncbi:ABC transporter substrate-binding protein [Geminicoccaceae bacterium 1502E]|nr:ABC transporter substrate-binding protein [Geminicoccaceae bacterium 1502E]